MYTYSIEDAVTIPINACPVLVNWLCCICIDVSHKLTSIDWNIWITITIPLTFVSSIGSGNGLVPVRQQAMISTNHYTDVIMTTMASQITSFMVVYSIVYSGADQRKHQSSASLAFVRGLRRDRWILRTKGSNAENGSIWWRHHVMVSLLTHI